MNNRKRIAADEIRGKGHIEAITLSSILGSPDASIDLYRTQLKKPLSSDEIELMLSNQAITLNAIANKSFELGCNLEIQVKNNPIIEKLTKNSIKNGFKAIELSRKCLVALNEFRNPKRSATFVKQQLNQINLGDHNGGANMDRITEGKATDFNPNMATVATVHRREN